MLFRSMNRKEITAIVIIAVTVILWFSSTWFPILNTTVVAAIACMLMFMPGVDLMDWKSYVAECDFNLLFMVGSVAITMGCVNYTGAMSWIMNKLFSGPVSYTHLDVYKRQPRDRPELHLGCHPDWVRPADSRRQPRRPDSRPRPEIEDSSCHRR